MHELLIQNFIKTHLNWRELLEERSITVKEDENYILLKYGISADFSDPIVQECRGIILNKSSYKVVCHSFDKFGNYGESYAPELDWTTARVQTKYDGSLIKLWYDNGAWHVSTNGTINAYKAPINYSDIAEGFCPYKTFGDLFDAARASQLPTYDHLDPANTYSFELCSPYNKIVCQYDTSTIYHIGTRNNETNEESNPNIGVQKPTEYPLHSLKECIEAATHLTPNEEGYVAVDAAWQRVKIKSPTYIAAHYLKGNGQTTLKGLIQYYLAGDIDEFVLYAPEYRTAVTNLKTALSLITARLSANAAILSSSSHESRKDYALAVLSLDTELSDYYFRLLREPSLSPEQYLDSLPVQRLLPLVEKNLPKHW